MKKTNSKLTHFDICLRWVNFRYDRTLLKNLAGGHSSQTVLQMTSIKIIKAEMLLLLEPIGNLHIVTKTEHTWETI